MHPPMLLTHSPVRVDRFESRNTLAHVHQSETTAAISSCGKQGLWKESQQLFHRMAQVDVKKDTVVYNAVIEALQSSGQDEFAREILCSLLS